MKDTSLTFARLRQSRLLRDNYFRISLYSHANVSARYIRYQIRKLKTCHSNFSRKWTSMSESQFQIL